MASEWVSTNGGPLILMPVAQLAQWTGIDVPTDRVVEASFRWDPTQPLASDCDRACDLREYAAPLAVGFEQALVLAGEPTPTTWRPASDGGYFAQWDYAESEADVEAALDAVPSDLQWLPKGTFTVRSAPLALFDSAEPGLEPLMPRLSVDLTPGEYQVHVAAFAPDPQTSLTLIRLSRAAT